ncbi:hypothetical protein Tco_0274251 [Tanacetum coccineum]
MGTMASEPYTRLKGVSLLMDFGIGLCAHSTCGVVDRGEGLKYTKFLAKDWECSVSELLPIIGDNYLGYTKSAYDMLPD